MSDNNTRKLFVLIAGAKGAVGSTVAAAVAVMQRNPDIILPVYQQLIYLVIWDLPTVFRLADGIPAIKGSALQYKHMGLSPDTSGNPLKPGLTKCLFLKHPGLIRI